MEPETFDKFYERKNKIKENLPTILAKVPQSLELIPHHPLYHTMILTAIKKLNEEHGSTEEAILKFIRDNFPNLSIAHARHVSHHLKKLEERKGIVRASNNRYMLPAEKEKVYVSEVARIFAKNRRQRSVLALSFYI